MGEEKGPEFYTGLSYISEKNRKIYMDLWVRACDKIEEYSIKDKRIIDLGCNIGLLSELLISRNIGNYTGVDFSPAVIKLAKQRLPDINFIQADLRDPEIQRSKKSTQITTYLLYLKP